MKVSRDHLIGWMCILRLQFEAGNVLNMPSLEQDQLLEEKWLEIDHKPDWDGRKHTRITQKGVDVSDLCGAEWGIGSALLRE